MVDSKTQLILIEKCEKGAFLNKNNPLILR